MILDGKLDRFLEDIKQKHKRASWVVISMIGFYGALAFFFEKYPSVGVWYTGLAAVIILLLFSAVCLLAYLCALLTKVLEEDDVEGDTR